ncbi:MAG: DoxX family membrane protein [Tunicatimonas sp.]
MIKRLRNIPREKYWDYFILVARFLIGWTFLRYGFNKLTEGQFGISDSDLLRPVGDVSLFKLSWYLFGHEPFKTIIGVSQIICGALLIVNRTAIIGAFVFLPIVATIFIIDLTVMSPDMIKGFAWRLSFYIVLDLLVLWHYKEKMKVIWQSVWNNVNTKFRFPIWAYLALPILAIFLDLVIHLPKILINLVLNPAETLAGFKKALELIGQLLETWAVNI